jgi:hypothetical protein
MKGDISDDHNSVRKVLTEEVSTGMIFPRFEKKKEAIRAELICFVYELQNLCTHVDCFVILCNILFRAEY